MPAPGVPEIGLGPRPPPAALSQFFPLNTATEAFPKAGRWKERPARSASSRSTCATPIIMAAPMGFYAKNGLNVESHQDRRLGGDSRQDHQQEYDAAHMLSPMPLAITMGAGSNPLPTPCRRWENINGQAITLRSSTRTSAIEGLERFKFAFRSTIRCTIICCAITSRARPRPGRRRAVRAVPPPEMVANLRADISTDFWGPTR